MMTVVVVTNPDPLFNQAASINEKGSFSCLFSILFLVLEHARIG